MSRSIAFKQADVTRAIRGAMAAGMKVSRAEIDQNGKIVIIAPSAEKPVGGELDAWLGKYAGTS